MTLAPVRRVVQVHLGRRFVDQSRQVPAEARAAVNAADPDRAAALVTDDVEVGGPRGAARGVDVLRGWVERSPASARGAPRR